MTKNIYLKLFLLTFLVFLFGQMWLGSFYEAQTSFLVLEKNSARNINLETVIENVLNFPYSLDNLELKRVGQSSIIKVTIQSQSQEGAKEYAQLAVGKIFETLSRYYDIKTQLDLRIVSVQEPRSNVWLQIKSTFFSSLLGSLLVIIILKIALKKTKGKISLKKIAPTKSFFSPLKKSVQEKPIEKKEEPTVVASDIPYTFPKKTAEKPMEKKPEQKITPEKTSSAPINLPLAGDEIERMFGAIKNGIGYKSDPIAKEAEPKEEKKEDDLIKEATPEEVKERLNKLLSGL